MRNVDFLMVGIIVCCNNVVVFASNSRNFYKTKQYATFTSFCAVEAITKCSLNRLYASLNYN